MGEGLECSGELGHDNEGDPNGKIGHEVVAEQKDIFSDHAEWVDGRTAGVVELKEIISISHNYNTAVRSTILFYTLFELDSFSRSVYLMVSKF